ncbi:MAG TPA: PIG-L deacetylase family protein, partial [Limnochordia bacterium]
MGLFVGFVTVIGALVGGLWLSGFLFLRRYSRLVPPERRADCLAAGERLLAAARGSVLVFAAHPDDVEYWLGGTLPRLAQRGVQVHVVLATRGERGGRRPDLGRVRTAEQERAGAILGYHRIIWLDLPDRGVKVTPELVARLRALLDEVQPSLVFTFDADKPLPPYVHPDHQAVGRAGCMAFADWAGSRDGARLCLFHTRRPNTLIDVQSTAELKRAAFAAHESQHGPPRPALRMVLTLLRWLFPNAQARGEEDTVEVLCCPDGAPAADARLEDGERRSARDNHPH